MKRILLIASIMLMASSVLLADVCSILLGTDFGFSSVNNAMTLGMNSSCQYLVPVKEDTLYFGVNGIANINWLFTSSSFNNIDSSAGGIIGPIFGIAESPKNFTSLSFGPGLYIEHVEKKNEIIGFGVGADLNHTFYIGTDESLGITLGTTGYFVFVNMAASESKQTFKFYGTAYMGFSFRFGDYPTSTNTYYNIY